MALAMVGGPVIGAQEGWDFSAIENTPVQETGRKRPFFTFATERVQSLSGKTSLKVEGKKIPAMEAALDIWARPEAWMARPIILINYKPLKQAVGLPEKQDFFSLEEIAKNGPLKGRMADVEALARSEEKPKLDRLQTEVRDVVTRIVYLEQLMKGSAFAVVPHPGETGGKWEAPDQATALYPDKEAAKKVEAAAEAIKGAFRTSDHAAFKAASQEFSEALASLNPEAYPSKSLMELETRYGKLHPFRWAWILLATAAIVLGLTSIAGRQTGYRIAWGLISVSLALQVYGFVARVIIGGRGPVTNMYESVLWVAFGTIFFAMIMEAIYRSRVIFAAATPVAVLCLIIADTQTVVLKSSIDPLEAVLRNNFWLSTHVTSITLSYAAFALGLGVAHIILGKVLLGRDVTAALYNYLYRALQIGVLLLAIGTILGGVWANYSWGRFWDWDPKETWALITLLAYLALLHGRFAGWWKGFGLAVGSILSFMAVVMAWYGVNFVLGEGLHSYGFGVGGQEYALGYVIAEVVFIAIVMVRRKASSKGASAEEDEAEMEEVEA